MSAVGLEKCTCSVTHVRCVYMASGEKDAINQCTFERFLKPCYHIIGVGYIGLNIRAVYMECSPERSPNQVAGCAGVLPRATTRWRGEDMGSSVGGREGHPRRRTLPKWKNRDTLPRAREDAHGVSTHEVPFSAGSAGAECDAIGIHKSRFSKGHGYEFVASTSGGRHILLVCQPVDAYEGVQGYIGCILSR